MTLQPDGTPDPAGAYDVPAEAAVHECPTCGAPFPDEQDWLLHRARTHGADAADGALDPSERAALETAIEREETALRRFRLQALGAVVLLYFLLLMTYALV